MIDSIRQLINDGKYKEAEDKIKATLDNTPWDLNDKDESEAYSDLLHFRVTVKTLQKKHDNPHNRAGAKKSVSKYP
ncbi:MAG: hypothetical protein IPP94_16725 [Ignavibacteria bacterium]|nr:hypothetical protein [Ignavibacteria bacterium]